VSAFHVDLHVLAAELLRVTRAVGVALLSTYSEAFWDERLAWFRAQADAGLIGPIDEAKTGDGAIVCEDGFTAGTVSPAAMEEALRGLDADMRIVEVDASCLFFELTRRG
jgi:2-polyprenyl-6-hydroxyphenyl methylase/3-demethylubiquinone-9 3-methyltransferase